MPTITNVRSSCLSCDRRRRFQPSLRHLCLFAAAARTTPPPSQPPLIPHITAITQTSRHCRRCAARPALMILKLAHPRQGSDWQQACANDELVNGAGDACGQACVINAPELRQVPDLSRSLAITLHTGLSWSTWHWAPPVAASSRARACHTRLFYQGCI